MTVPGRGAVKPLREPVRTPVLTGRGLRQSFRIRGGRGVVQALRGVDLTVARGETVGLVGESGSGKSTLARIAVGLLRPSGGQLRVLGQEVGTTDRWPAPLRGAVQMIFQDPRGSLNPRLTVGRIVAEPLRSAGLASGRMPVRSLLDRVRLPAGFEDLHPHQLSGGQCQRVAIARAIAAQPALIVADEPVSALDVSVQAQVLNLLKEIREELDTSFLFISHDLGVVRFFCDRVSVLYLGQVVETGQTDAVFVDPQHPYTQALESAAPAIQLVERADRILLRGEPPRPENPPTGCPFHTRCHMRIGDICATEEPPAYPTDTGAARCHLLDRADPVAP